MYAGRLYFRCGKGNKEHLALARKALRLLGKVASNKIQVVEYPSLEVVARYPKGAFLWIGHDAARWLREDPARMAYYNENWKRGYRPLDT